MLRRVALSIVLASTPAVAEAQVSDYSGHATFEAAQYADTDHVFVTTPSLAAAVSKPTAGWEVSGSYLVDVVSAASVDIVSTASRRWQETRQAGTLEGSFKPGTFGVSVSSAVSSEPDYLSYAGGLLLSQDLFEKNVTLLAGYGYAHDVAGRTGTPFAVYSHAFDTNSLKVGATFILDRLTTANVLFDAQLLNGDSSETYRYVPLFAPGVTVPVGASIDVVNAARLPVRVAEQVPSSRNRYALTLRAAHRFHASTLRLEERLYADTWGLLAQTADAWWLADVGKRLELGPHARLHDQSEVNFWRRTYVLEGSTSFPTFRTGDRELGPLLNVTGGGLVRVGVGPRQAPMKWAIALDVQATYSRYLDDLYLTDRTATLGALSLTGEL